MAMWGEEEYVKRAAELARQSAVSKKSLNDVCEKAAHDDALNPEEIRTLVRLTNVAMFQHLFREKDQLKAPDRQVNFEVGDPEAVISRLQTSAAPPESASIMNDKLAHEIPDMMAARRAGYVETAKTAAETPAETPRPPRKDFAILAMRKLAAEYDNRRLEAGHRWELKVAELYDHFKAAPGYGPSFALFAKDAAAAFGDDAMPELTSLWSDLRSNAPLPSGDDVAKLAEHHVYEDSADLERLKLAIEARKEYVACQEAVAWVVKHAPRDV